MDKKQPKYEYHLYTWGGFYNKEYLKIHNKPRGNFWFDTAEERQQFINELKEIEEKLNARHLAMTLSEGYCCRISTVLHRVVEWEGKRYYSNYDMGINYPMSAAKYHLEWKWTCGFNDYPLGEDFDYENNKPKVIQEWITGAEQEVELIEKTVVSDEAIKYLNEVKKKFKGTISGAWVEQDYLTAPYDDEYIQGMRECLDLKLIKRTDDGSGSIYIQYKITKRGYEVLKLAK